MNYQVFVCSQSEQHFVASVFGMPNLTVEGRTAPPLSDEGTSRESIYQEREETARKIAVNMLSKGVSLESIVDFTGLTLEQVQQLQTQQSENQS
ncbi:hypothetical protein RIVM261_028720 [Rivularia sp. IAM M-261]|nr:hypothetical protein CAL7716_012180 [Calothrix sp. PCC 7716]GJD17916.1 hypothetical protein RIVM261_028720 [Rivularia sp. IAM M-261]